MSITCAEMEEALRDSIELRWKPLADGEDIINVPSCQLCKVCAKHMGVETYNVIACQACPLSMANQQCILRNCTLNQESLFYKFKTSCGGQRIYYALTMVDKLQELYAFYFPKGWDE